MKARIPTTGSILDYTQAAEVDLAGPVPQLLRAGFTGAQHTARGPIILAGVNLAFAAFLVAQFATIVVEASRLPMGEAWDHLMPSAFIRKTPVELPRRGLTFLPPPSWPI